jgi:dGTP triphosphohydrolase
MNSLKVNNNSVKRLSEAFCVDEHLSQFNPKYEETVDNFFDLWSKYKDARKKNNEVAICINCKKPGGTTFVLQRNSYLMKCNAENKCNLYVCILKGEMTNLADKLAKLKNKLDDISYEVVLLKYNAAFGYVKENESKNHYDRLMHIYSQTELEYEAFLVLRNSESETTSSFEMAQSINESIRQIKRTFYEINENASSIHAMGSRAGILPQKDINNKSVLLETFKTITKIVKSRIRVQEAKLREIKDKQSQPVLCDNLIWVDQDEKTQIAITY